MAGVQIDGVNNKIDFDDDLDTSISANTDDTLVIEAGGNTMATITATTFTINDGTTITTADNTDTLSLVSTDADANAGAALAIKRNSASPADGDLIGNISYYFLDDGGSTTFGASLEGKILDVTNGTEDSQLDIYTNIAGTKTNRQSFNATETVFNEGSIDSDFRVESNGDTHMLFVDGGNDHVNIKASADLGGVLNVGGTTVIQTSDNTDTLSLISTDTDSAIGPNLNLYRNAGNGADADNLATVAFAGNDDAGNATDYFRITAQIDDASNGSEDVYVDFRTLVAGTERKRISLLQAETVFNEDSADIDFRIESNALTHAFFIDGGTDHVSIGNSSTSLYTLDIKQNADFTGSNSDTANEAPLRVWSTHNNGRGAIAIGGNNNNGIFNKGANDLVVQGYNSVTFDVSTTNDDKFGTKTERFRINSSGTLATGAETDPDVNAGGITLNQSTNDGNILSFKSTGDVAHGITNEAETDTYFAIRKAQATKGGVRIDSLSEQGDEVVSLLALYNNTGGEINTTTSASANGAIKFFVNKYNNSDGDGAANQTSPDAANLFVVNNYTSSAFIVKGNGAIHSNAAAGTFDTYEDAELVRAFDLSHGKGVIASQFDKHVRYNHEALAEAELVGREEDGTPNMFMNVTGFVQLHNGAIWQQYEKHQRLAEAVYEMAKETLGADKADAILKKHDIKLLN